jgi:hypothetical protein
MYIHTYGIIEFSKWSASSDGPTAKPELLVKKGLKLTMLLSLTPRFTCRAVEFKRSSLELSSDRAPAPTPGLSCRMSALGYPLLIRYNTSTMACTDYRVFYTTPLPRVYFSIVYHERNLEKFDDIPILLRCRKAAGNSLARTCFLVNRVLLFLGREEEYIGVVLIQYNTYSTALVQPNRPCTYCSQCKGPI